MTDFEYKILALLRVVELDAPTPSPATKPTPSAEAPTKDEEETRFAVGETYNLTRARPFDPITEEKLRRTLQTPIEMEAPNPIPEVFAEIKVTAAPGDDKKSNKGGKKRPDKAAKQEKWAKEKKKPKDMTLKKVIKEGLGPDYGTALSEHCILLSGLDPNLKIADLDLSPDSSQIAALLHAFQEGDKIIKSCMETPQKGFIVTREYTTDAPTSPTPDPSTNLQAYEEFHPYPFIQFTTTPTLHQTEFPNFDKSIDEFFSKLESQKLQIRARQAELSSLKKLESVKQNHSNQVRGFEMMKEESVKCASAIEGNLGAVDGVISTLRSFIASGMDWIELEELVKDERKKGNPLAKMIGGLKLEVGMVTVLLRDPDLESDSDSDSDESDSDESGDESRQKRTKTIKPIQSKKADTGMLKIDIDIYSSAHSNARKYYDSSKLFTQKHTKTVLAASKALKSAERKISLDTKQTHQPATIKKIRHPFWFEKYIWFISSENYLVVGGRDASQNEVLVRRYLKKGDVYVHADLHGAASVIIKNITTDPSLSDTQIPPTTLHQAGTMSVCQSRAWDAKIVTSAWWVFDHQVSKTAPTGEYLSTGSFMVRGKKNWVPPVQLVYGVGVLFRIGEDDVARHYWERRPWGRGEEGAGVGSLGKGGSAGSLDGENEVVGNVNDGDEDDGNGNGNGDSGSSDGEDDVQAGDADDGEDEINAEDELIHDDGEMKNVKITELDPDGDSDSEKSEPAQPTLKNDEQPEKPHDKYNLAELGGDDDDDEEEEVQNDAVELDTPDRGGKKLSAKERRDLKKKRKGGVVDDSTPVEEPKAAAKPKSTPPPIPTPQPPQAPNIRGKKGKMKKAKDKYADQDEEDRQLMLELMASAKGPQPKGKKAKADAIKKEAEAAKQAQRKPTNKARPNGTQPTKVTQPQPDLETTAVPITTTTDQPQPSQTESSEILKLLAEENVSLPDEDQAATLSYLDSLTGQPHPLDTLLHAVPVCAPWTALSKYKYKVKLVPGALKKGKAAKSCLNGFLVEPEPEKRRGGGGSEAQSKMQGEAQGEGEVRTGQTEKEKEEAAKRERELIKAVPEMEMIGVMMGKVKVVSGSAVESGKKKGKKGK